jgi:hypothetical protein
MQDCGPVEATVHLSGDGERHPLGDSQLVIKATGEETGGTFFLSETTIAPGFPGPPPHRHERLVDMFYVLDASLASGLARRRISSVRGRSSVRLPASSTHSATQ